MPMLRICFQNDSAKSGVLRRLFEEGLLIDRHARAVNIDTSAIAVRLVRRSPGCLEVEKSAVGKTHVVYKNSLLELVEELFPHCSDLGIKRRESKMIAWMRRG